MNRFLVLPLLLALSSCSSDSTYDFLGCVWNTSQLKDLGDGEFSANDANIAAGRYYRVDFYGDSFNEHAYFDKGGVDRIENVTTGDGVVVRTYMSNADSPRAGVVLYVIERPPLQGYVAILDHEDYEDLLVSCD